MTGFNLIVNAATIRLKTTGPATGDIVLQLGSVLFPHPKWNDFVVVIVAAWVDALVRLLQKHSDRESVRFMEGPYEVELERIRDDLIQIRALQRPNRDHAVGVGASVDLVKNALETADVVLRACQENSHSSNDVDWLQRATQSLRHEAEKW